MKKNFEEKVNKAMMQLVESITDEEDMEFVGAKTYAEMCPASGYFKFEENGKVYTYRIDIECIKAE